jgi:hypothetical protein
MATEGEDSMRRSAALFFIAIAFGATTLGAQAAPKAIRACQTISEPGSYVLERDLVLVGTLDCLDIAADFVTVDLAGFS